MSFNIQCMEVVNKNKLLLLVVRLGLGLCLVATTVSHFSYAPPFQGPHFLTKMLESNILYDNLLIDILSVWWHRENIEITHVNQSAPSNAILTKMLVQLECLYFLFAFCPRNYPWWSLCQKNTQNNCFIQVKPLFLVVEVSNTYVLKKCSFWRHINVSYNN